MGCDFGTQVALQYAKLEQWMLSFPISPTPEETTPDGVHCSGFITLP